MNDTIYSFLLGLIQGLTEFLPISSSGHLVIFQDFFGFSEPMLFFDVCLHTGTLLAVVLFFKEDVIKLCKSPFIIFKKKSFSEALKEEDFKLLCLILISTIPTGIIGLLIQKYFENALSSFNFVAAMLIFTSLFLWISKNAKDKNIDIAGFTFKMAIIIGIVQGIAVLPGISRSGSTIICALFLGIDKKLSAKYSFLCSLPAIFGAQILTLKDLSSQSIMNINDVLLGSITAFIVGYISLKWLLKIIQKGKLYLFAPYCFLFSVISLILKYYVFN